MGLLFERRIVGVWRPATPATALPPPLEPTIARNRSRELDKGSSVENLVMMARIRCLNAYGPIENKQTYTDGLSLLLLW